MGLDVSAAWLWGFSELGTLKPASWAQGVLLWGCSQPWQGGDKVSKALGPVPQRPARVGAVPAAFEGASLDPASARVSNLVPVGSCLLPESRDGKPGPLEWGCTPKLVGKLLCPS